MAVHAHACDELEMHKTFENLDSPMVASLQVFTIAPVSLSACI